VFDVTASRLAHIRENNKAFCTASSLIAGRWEETGGFSDRLKNEGLKNNRNILHANTLIVFTGAFHSQNSLAAKKQKSENDYLMGKTGLCLFLYSYTNKRFREQTFRWQNFAFYYSSETLGTSRHLELSRCCETNYTLPMCLTF